MESLNLSSPPQGILLCPLVFVLVILISSLVFAVWSLLFVLVVLFCECERKRKNNKSGE